MTDEIDLAYIFKHALTQKAADDTLLKSRRAIAPIHALVNGIADET